MAIVLLTQSIFIFFHLIFHLIHFHLFHLIHFHLIHLFHLIHFSFNIFQVDGVYMVMGESNQLREQATTFSSYIGVDCLKLVDEQCSCHGIVAENMNDMKVSFGFFTFIWIYSINFLGICHASETEVSRVVEKRRKGIEIWSRIDRTGGSGASKLSRCFDSSL